MNLRTLIAASGLAIAASLAGPSFAQEQTINGIAVPATELEAVQTKCDELLSNSATGLAKTLPAPATPAAELPAAGASNDAATTESAAEAPVDPAAVDPGAVAIAKQTPAEGGNMAADSPADAATTIDLASLTAEICTEGGFTAAMD